MMHKRKAQRPSMTAPTGHPLPINFMTAQDGKLVLQAGGIDGPTWACASPQEIADVLQRQGVVDRVLFSSSVDFAHEYGFAHSLAAHDMWTEGRELYERRVAQAAEEGDQASRRERSAA